MRSSLCCVAMALLLAGNAPPANPHHSGTRHRAVAGWSIKQRAENDGGYVVELLREAGTIHVRYTAAFWRGNDGRIQTIMVERGDCSDGDEIGRHVLLRAAALRAMFARIFETCAVPPRQAAAILAGLEPAYTLALAWSRDAERATAAEAAAISN